MIRLFFSIALFVTPSAFASSTIGELKAPVEKNSCRLANMYFKGSTIFGSSAGIVSFGKYATAKSASACRASCESDEKGRLSGKPESFSLKVACFFGTEQIYERTHN